VNPGRRVMDRDQAQSGSGNHPGELRRWSLTTTQRLVSVVVLTWALVSGATGAGQVHAVPGPESKPALNALTPAEHGLGTASQPGPSSALTFAIAADMRSFAGPGACDTMQYFGGAVEAIAALGNIAFLVSPGDLDPPGNVRWTITRTLGITFTWYPVVGNHELPGAGQEAAVGGNLRWLNSYDYGTVNPGPSGCPTTTYSFDYGSVHLAVLNEYCDSSGDGATPGDVPDHLYNWLLADLSNTSQPQILVFGHEPAYPQPDADNGRIRHIGDSLDQYPTHRDRFWHLLRDRGVLAYICGHTHNYSAARIDGVWQIDVGHARGLGDTGVRSTFVIIRTNGQVMALEVYRDDANGGPYTPVHREYLAARECFLPLMWDQHR